LFIRGPTLSILDGARSNGPGAPLRGVAAIDALDLKLLPQCNAVLLPDFDGEYDVAFVETLVIMKVR
jgi:hypothetical protein